MNPRPEIHPNVFAGLAESAPDRLRRKLDKNPEAAQGWEWKQEGDSWQIEAGNELLMLDTEGGIINSAEQIRCSCLLSPRCFHVLAVLSVLELAGEITSESSEEEPEIESAQAEPIAELSDAQIEAARAMFRAGSAILASGARAAGTLLQSHLLRAIHECRSLGLHRLAAGGLRVVENVRQLRSENDAFKSEELSSDLAELFRVAWSLLKNESRPSRELLGVARRNYEPIGSLRLTGLFSELILTRSGYAGVVTYLLSDAGEIYSVSNVRPGNAGRVQEAYQTGAEIGGLSIPHKTLARQSLLLQKATRSADFRLGGGKECRAVTTETLGWNSEAVAKRFKTPVSEQVQRVFEQEPKPYLEQPAGWDLLFLQGTLLGSDGENLFLAIEDGQTLIRLKIASDQAALPFRENLELLARVPGFAVRCIARMVPSSPGDALALAIAPSNENEKADFCRLPEAWGGHGNLGIDRWERGFFQKAERKPQIISPPKPNHEAQDGLDFMRRRLQAVAIGGRHALPSGRVKAAAREARALGSNLQPTAAGLLKVLAQSAIETQTDLLGVRFPADPTSLAESWLAGAIYEETARRHFQKWNWLRQTGERPA